MVSSPRWVPVEVCLSPNLWVTFILEVLEGLEDQADLILATELHLQGGKANKALEDVLLPTLKTTGHSTLAVFRRPQLEDNTHQVCKAHNLKTMNASPVYPERAVALSAEAPCLRISSSNNPRQMHALHVLQVRSRLWVDQAVDHPQGLLADPREDLKGVLLVPQGLAVLLRHSSRDLITNRARLPALRLCPRSLASRDQRRLKIWVSHKESRTMTALSCRHGKWTSKTIVVGKYMDQLIQDTNT